MSDDLNEWVIVGEYARVAARRITRKTISALQHMTDGLLSGDDSGLETTWDEICAQVQGQLSVYWDAYEDTVCGIVLGFIKELPTHEREALWLQSDAGANWEGHGYPVDDDDTAAYLTREYVLAEADSWSNARIRAYLERSGTDDWE